jgi:Na+/melibiose symporter-like transporter
MWLQMVADTITNPRETARHLININPPMAVRWQAFVLLSILSTVLPMAAFWIAGGEARAEVAASNPFVMAAVQFGFNIVAVYLIQGLGQWAGGKGQFADALLLMVWMQFILLILQVAQCIAIIVAPVFLVPIMAVGVVLLFWLLSNFTAELHGFQSALRVFAVIFGLMFLVGLAITPFLDPAEMTVS